MKNNIEDFVKKALLDEVNEISDTEDIFPKIKEEINTESIKRNKDYKKYTSSHGFKKYFSLAACLTLIFTTLTFVYSAEARALASQAISSIRSIFVVEEVDDNFQIVEKSSNGALIWANVSRDIELTDEELEKKLGFSVRFPETLFGSFNLEYKTMGVQLGKAVDYESSQKLESDMFNAIEDDYALDKLKPYDPSRKVFGAYKKSDQSTIFINISRNQTLSGNKNLPAGPGAQMVIIGELDGVWVETSFPKYPYKQENGVGKEDMSQKPTIKESRYLMWQKSDKLYTLNVYEEYKLTMEEAVKIAEDFMKYN